MTQDVFKAPTFLDSLGDIKEDLSVLPVFMQRYVVILGIFSYFAEAFILISIPFVMKKNKSNTLEKLIFVILLELLVYFVVVMLLDPRFRVR